MQKDKTDTLEDTPQPTRGVEVENNHISLTLRGVRLVDKANKPLMDSLVKTFNSASRCAFKRFESIGLNAMLRIHKSPNKRKLDWSKFKGCPIVDGRPMAFEAPAGMSDEMWLQVRKESYAKKIQEGLSRPVNPFWQIDKDLGSPILGTEEIVGDWMKEHGYELDSVMLHNAILSGFKSYKSFERQRSKYKTSKNSPSFGEMEGRSKRRLSRGEFQLTKNASIHVAGCKTRHGNPKFRFDVESREFTFTYKRKRIAFDFKGSKLSKKEYKNLANIVEAMENGKLPVSVTLTKTSTDGMSFNVSLSYSPMELDKYKGIRGRTRQDISCGLWVGDDILHHRILDRSTNKVLLDKTYRMDKYLGARENLKYLEDLQYKNDWKTLSEARKGMARRANARTHELLKRIFNVNNSHCVGEVVVETPSSKSKRNFNASLIGFSKSKVELGMGKSCFMNHSRFVSLVKNQCARSQMKFVKTTSTFGELKAVMEANTMQEAIRNAASNMMDSTRNNKRNASTSLADLAEKMNLDPSMLDWVRHLLHNKRNRQARLELRKAFKKRAVEGAVRLLDNRSRRVGCCKLAIG